MRIVIELIIAISIIFGSSRLALIKTHDFIKEMAFNKIQNGLSSTQKFNRLLINGGK